VIRGRRSDLRQTGTNSCTLRCASPSALAPGRACHFDGGWNAAGTAARSIRRLAGLGRGAACAFMLKIHRGRTTVAFWLGAALPAAWTRSGWPRADIAPPPRGPDHSAESEGCADCGRRFPVVSRFTGHSRTKAAGINDPGYFGWQRSAVLSTRRTSAKLLGGPYIDFQDQGPRLRGLSPRMAARPM